MARAKRRTRGPAVARQPVPAPVGPTLAGRRVAPPREWRWRTFPVFLTFAATLFLTALIATISPGLGSLLWILGVVLFALALSHLVTVYLIAPRLRPSDRPPPPPRRAP